MSYDPVPVLAAFAEKRGVTFSLLSDEGSKTIRALGLLNEQIAEQQAHFGANVEERHHGLPHPGTFVLNEEGVIVEKLFEQHHRYRPSGVSFIETSETSFDSAGSPPPVAAQAEAAEIQVKTWLGKPTYRPYQRLRLNVSIQIPEGLHVYGRPIPEDYIPLTVDIEPLEGLEVGTLELPQPRPFSTPGVSEEFHAYEGAIRGVLPFTLLKNIGDVMLQALVGYQACSDRLCYPPSQVTLQLSLQGLDLIRD